MISHATLSQIAHSTGQLLLIDLDPVVRLCTYGSVSALGAQWLLGDFAIDTLEENPQGVSAISITLGDVDHAWSNRLMSEFRPDIACEWHLLYRGAQGWETDQQFGGVLEQPKLRSLEVQLEARLGEGHTNLVPRVGWNSPYSLPRGAQRVINGTTYTVE